MFFIIYQGKHEPNEVCPVAIKRFIYSICRGTAVFMISSLLFIMKKCHCLMLCAQGYILI